MAYQSDKSGYIGFQGLDPNPVPSAPPPYTPHGGYWDPCGDYSGILEESWRFFCEQMGQGWVFKEQKKFLKVETRKADKYRVSGIRLSGELASINKPGFGKGSTMDNLKYQLFGIEALKEFPSIDPKSVRLLEQPGPNTNVYTFVEKYSWPMTNREYLTVEQMKKDPTTGHTVIIGTPVILAGFPEKAKPIRGVQEYLYILETSRLNPSNVFCTFYTFFDIKGEISPADQESAGMSDIVKLFLELPKYI